MNIIGITGGVGSGKSRVLSYIEETYSCVICQADHVAWELQRPGERGYVEIVKHFGEKILNEDGTINRSALGQIVFSNEKELWTLNAIMHPAVKEEIRKRIILEEEKGTKLFVLEAALLIEEHYNEICDELWYIYTDEQIRRERLKESRGYSDEKIDSMIGAQLPEKVFRRECQVVIDNSGDFAYTCVQIQEAIKKMEIELR